MVSHAISAITPTLKKPKLRNRCVHSLLPKSAVGPSGTVSVSSFVVYCQSWQLDHPFRSGHSHVTRSAGTEAWSYTENGTQYPGPGYSEFSTPLSHRRKRNLPEPFRPKEGHLLAWDNMRILVALQGSILSRAAKAQSVYRPRGSRSTSRNP